MKPIIYVTLLILGSTNSHAEIKEFQLYKYFFKIDILDNWKVIQKEIATPFKLIGPSKNDLRPVVTITPIDLNSSELTMDDSKKANTQYKRSRLQWLQKFGGSLIEFYPSTSNEGKRKSTQIFSYAYTFNHINYLEKSHYIRCKGKNVFHLKTLVSLKDNLYWENKIKKIIDSFSCK